MSSQTLQYLVFDSEKYTQNIKDIVTNIVSIPINLSFDNDKIIIFNDDSIFLVNVLFNTCCVIPLRIQDENNILNYVNELIEYLISTINNLNYEKNIINSIGFKCFFYFGKQVTFSNYKYNFFTLLNLNSSISKFNTSIGMNKFEYKFNFNDMSEYKIPSTTNPLSGFSTNNQQPSTTNPLSGFSTNNQQPSTTNPLSGFSTTNPLSGVSTNNQQPSTTNPFSGFSTNNQQPSTTNPFSGFSTNNRHKTVLNIQNTSQNKPKYDIFSGFSTNIKKS